MPLRRLSVSVNGCHALCIVATTGTGCSSKAETASRNRREASSIFPSSSMIATSPSAAASIAGTASRSSAAGSTP